MRRHAVRARAGPRRRVGRRARRSTTPPRRRDSRRSPSRSPRAIAPQAAVDNAKSLIQVLGGIGYTWEHDAHLFLKRALSLRPCSAARRRWRGRAADLALGGRGATACSTSATPSRCAPRCASSSRRSRPDDQQRDGRDRRRRLPRAALAGAVGPRRRPVEQLVIDEEFAAAGVRDRTSSSAAGRADDRRRTAPPSSRRGSSADAARRDHLVPDVQRARRRLRPRLAATKAEKVEGGWTSTGQKVWTSLAAGRRLGDLPGPHATGAQPASTASPTSCST